MLKLSRSAVSSDSTAEFTIPPHSSGPVPRSAGLDDPTVATPIPSGGAVHPPDGLHDPTVAMGFDYPAPPPGNAAPTHVRRESRMREVKASHPRRSFGRTFGAVLLGLGVVMGLGAAGYAYGEARYQAGVEAGFSTGEQSGAAAAENASYNEGYNDGVIEGYHDGYDAGYDKGGSATAPAEEKAGKPGKPAAAETVD